VGLRREAGNCQEISKRLELSSITEQVDPDACEADWDTEDDLRPRLHARIVVGAKTDLGCVRENNEDKFDLLEPRDPATLALKGRLYGVADGMGGHAAGQIASEFALKTLIQSYFADPSDNVEESLKAAVDDANLAVYDGSQTLPERQGMGTTVTAAIVREDLIYVVHVGDSRAYLVRDGEVRQITQDHSWVAEQVRMGSMTLEEALGSPFRNIILRSVGTGPTVEPDVYREEIQAGDVLVICSDGLSGHVDETDIATYAGREIIDVIGPSVAALQLVNLANERGGRDNITVVIVSIESIEPFAQAPPGH
jgi:serine/threonine protein phosphatase PrpC